MELKGFSIAQKLTLDSQRAEEKVILADINCNLGEFVGCEFVVVYEDLNRIDAY